MTLYEITQAAEQLKSLLDEDEIDEATFSDTLESIGAEDKVETYCQIIRKLQADTNEITGELDRLKAAKARIDKAVDRMKCALGEFIEACGGEKQTGKTFTVWLQASKRTVIDDDAAVPEQYCRHQLIVDKEAVKKALERGEVISGARIEVTKGVRIR